MSLLNQTVKTYPIPGAITQSVNLDGKKKATVPIAIPQARFWSNASGSYKIDPESLHQFLTRRGYMTYRPEGIKTRILVRIKDKIVQEVTPYDIREFAWNYIDSEYEFSGIEERKLVKAEFYKNKSLFSKDNLVLLPLLNLKECKDTKEKSYLFFNDCFFEITANSIKVNDYSKLEGFVFATDISNIDFKPSLKPGQTVIDSIEPAGEFFEFIKDLAKNDNKTVNENSLQSLFTIIGYLVHRYKDPANAKAIILMDSYKDGSANGGSGKSLLTRGIGKVRESAFQDGKYFTSSDKFVFSHVSYGTRILIIDDVPKNFDFEKIFPLITEQAVIERKYENKFVIPFSESPKIVMTTNYTVEGSGNSHKRRKIEFILSEEYNADYTPEDRFGHLLFTEWEVAECQKFYHFITFCVVEFLKHGIIEPKFNVAERKLKMETSKEFIDFMNTCLPLGEKVNKKTIYDDFYSKNPGHYKIEMTTFRNWLKLFADANGLQFIESHSGNESFFEYTF
jgi:hypothetical protein